MGNYLLRIITVCFLSSLDEQRSHGTDGGLAKRIDSIKINKNEV
jgi:hypothetical protein